MVRQLVKEVGGCPWCCGQDDGAAAGQNSKRKGSVVTYLQLILGNQLKYNMKKLEEEQIMLGKVLQAGKEAIRTVSWWRGWPGWWSRRIGSCRIVPGERRQPV